MKKNFIIIGTLILLFGAIYFVVFTQTDTFVPHYNTSDYPNTYYQNLAQQCESRESSGCCLSSVKTMQAGNYQLASANKCLAGYELNTLKCSDSYYWCEPGQIALESQCVANGGKYLRDYRECVWSVGNPETFQSVCKVMNGTFNSCASPCRHNPSADGCVASCVFVCSF